MTRAARYSYLIHDYEPERQLLLATDSDNQVEFITNILKAVTIGSSGSEGLRRAAGLLIVRGFVDQGIELLLMTGNWQGAAEHLMTLGMLAEAAMVLRVQEPSPERNELLLELAERMFAVEMTAYAVILLSEVGDFDQIATRFRNMGETGQAAFLAKLAWE
jgi:hypothetical protein